MQIPTVTKTLSPDIGELPALPVEKPARWFLIIPVIFTTALVALVATEVAKQRTLAALDTRIRSANESGGAASREKPDIEAKVAEVQATQTFVNWVRAWKTQTPMMQPVVAVVIGAAKAARLNSVTLERRSGEEAAYLLTISFAGDGTGVGEAIVEIQKELKRLGWKATENEAAATNNGYRYALIISPP